MWKVQTQSDFIAVRVDDGMMQDASDRNGRFYGQFGNNGTHRTNGKQRIVGYLAEAAIKATFGNLEYAQGCAVDFVGYGKTFDSKAQGANGKPSLHFDGTLYEEQKSREVDVYIFSRVKNDLSVVWICGLISKSQYLREAIWEPAGTKNGNFTYDQARYRLPYGRMYKVDFLYHLEDRIREYV